MVIPIINDKCFKLSFRVKPKITNNGPNIIIFK